MLATPSLRQQPCSGVSSQLSQSGVKPLHHGLAQGLQSRGLAAQHQQAASAADRLHPQGDLGDQGQAAPAAAEQAHQVVAGHVFHNPPAGMGADAITAHQADADQLIADAQMPLAQAAGEPPGHQPPHRSGTGPERRRRAPGPIDW